jgi:CRP/FNR family cyclic AMP-dependent transcriptional regulator
MGRYGIEPATQLGPPVQHNEPVDKSVILAGHELFRDMPPVMIERLASHARLGGYPAGRQIFRKGDKGLGLFAVISGLVKISVTSDDGKEIVLNRIRANEVFGELALLDGGPRTADAVTLEETRLLSLDRRDLLSVLNDDPAVAIRLLAIVSARLRQTSEQVEDMSFAEPSRRLAKAVLRLLELQGARPGGEVGRVAITQQELGRTIGLSRESTNKHLREWEGLGWLALQKGAVIVRDRSSLLALAGDPALPEGAEDRRDHRG